MGESVTSIKEQNKSASSSLFKRNVRKFMNNKLALIGLVIVVVITIACIIGMIMGVDYNTPVLSEMKQAPGNGHMFGTDTVGRDLLARVLVGGCYSILIGVFCAVMSSVIGAILGSIAGYFGGKADMILIRISEIFQAFPQLVLVMMLVAIVNKRGLTNLLFIFVFTGWMTTFRMVRNEFMSLKGETYVKVCEAFGMKKSNIMFKQILPNVMVLDHRFHNDKRCILYSAGSGPFLYRSRCCRQYADLGKYFECGKICIRCNKSVVDLGIPRACHQSFCSGD